MVAAPTLEAFILCRVKRLFERILLNKSFKALRLQFHRRCLQWVTNTRRLFRGSILQMSNIL